MVLLIEIGQDEEEKMGWDGAGRGEDDVFEYVILGAKYTLSCWELGTVTQVREQKMS